MKKCTDKMRNADESNLMAGDKVLLRQLQPRANKWTVQFELSSTRSLTSVAAVLWSSCEVEAI